MEETRNIKFTLGDTLEEIGITKNKLAVEAKVRPATVLNIARGEVKAIQFDTIVSLLDTLNELSDRKICVEDIFLYEGCEKNGEGDK